jgi:pseudouridine synthase
VYEARVRGVPDGGALKRLSRGVVLEGRRTSPATVSLLTAGRGRSGDQAVVRLTITEGRKRQVRQMCEAIGHPVVRLRRVRIGPIQDTGLKPGQYRDLAPGEIKALRRAVALTESDGESSPTPQRPTPSATPRARRRKQ